MVSLLRKYQQTLMILVTVMVIIAFVWLYNGTRFDKLGTDAAYRVYGKTLTQADVERTARRFHVAMSLGLRDLVGGLSGATYDKNQAFENFVWNSFVLDHEANALGIAPTNTDVVSAMKGLQVFQTNDTFDPMKYQEFSQSVLGPNGITDAQVEDLVRDELRLKRLMDLIGSTVDATSAESRALFVQQHQKLDVSLVQFSQEEFTKAVQPKDDEVKKYFEDHKATLKTEEKRVVRFVKIDLSDAEKALKDKERVKAMQKLTARVEEFTQHLAEKMKFEDVAQKMELKVQTTPEFTEAQGCPNFASIPQAASAAFQLTEKAPDSEPVQAETGYCLLHLDKILASRPLTFEEAKPKIITQIKTERGHNALMSKANEARSKIEAGLKAGKSFADAAKDAGQKVESFPPFSVTEPADKPNANEIAEKAIELSVNDLSDFVTTPDGGLLIHMDKKEPVDDAKFSKEIESQLKSLRNRKRIATFFQWLQQKRKAADVQSLQEVRQRRG